MTGSVSVIIPCYNGAAFLREAIESALGQLPAPGQVIVVDDGSTDESVDIARSFSEVDVIAQPNCGVSAARNAGLAQARGEFVVFLDADDILLPGALAAGAAALAAEADRVMVYGGTEIIDAVGGHLRYSDQPIRAVTARMIFLGTHPVCSQSMLRRDAVVGAGGFRSGLAYSEDMELWLRLAAAGGALFCHGQRVAKYRRHGGSASQDAMRLYRTWLELVQEGEQGSIAGGIAAGDWPEIRVFIKRSAGRYLPFQVARLVRRGRIGGALKVLAFYARLLPHSAAGTFEQARLRARQV